MSLLPCSFFAGKRATPMLSRSCISLRGPQRPEQDGAPVQFVPGSDVLVSNGRNPMPECEGKCQALGQWADGKVPGPGWGA